MRTVQRRRSRPSRARRPGSALLLWFSYTSLAASCSSPLHMRSAQDAGRACPNGWTSCDGTCVDTQTESNNCGGCGSVCTAVSPSTAQCAAGRCLVTLAAGQPFPSDIAVNDAYVYWVNQGTADNNYADGAVMRVLLAGGTPTALASGQPHASGVALDATNVYWTRAGTTDADGAVMRMPLDGGSPMTLASEQPSPGPIVADVTSVYWGNAGTSNAYYKDGSVMKLALGDGTLTTLVGGGLPDDIVVDAMSVYWTNFENAVPGPIMKVPISGGVPVVLATATSSPLSIAIDATSVYWTSGHDGTVMMVPCAGGPPTTLASAQAYPVGVAVDSTSVYWTNEGTGANNLMDGSVMKIALGGDTLTTLAVDRNGPSRMAIDPTSVYWTGHDGTIMKLSPK